VLEITSSWAWLVFPHLRREEDVLAVDVRRGDAVADGGLVAVDLCRVDVTIPHLQGRPDALRTLLWVLVLPGADPQHRHLLCERRALGRLFGSHHLNRREGDEKELRM